MTLKILGRTRNVRSLATKAIFLFSGFLSLPLRKPKLFSLDVHLRCLSSTSSPRRASSKSQCWSYLAKSFPVGIIVVCGPATVRSEPHSPPDLFSFSTILWPLCSCSVKQLPHLSFQRSNVVTKIRASRVRFFGNEYPDPAYFRRKITRSLSQCMHVRTHEFDYVLQSGIITHSSKDTRNICAACWYALWASTTYSRTLWERFTTSFNQNLQLCEK